ncbi:hypothetical protein [Streptomyces cinnamoneus]|uniref:Uncharacterized protein n=1 Tax=Streptomyces cinnamoneus TaxID=53446 RepID=A0A918TWU5_STRCJ|nr:hypothetical protein [Streptomyces cinnamoneus]GHC60220.1 hypothetical protein GCM10010507_41610 [Streptomyces cinnamoneus]
MIVPIVFTVLGAAAALFGISLAFDIGGVATALSQNAQARSERVYRRLGGQGTLGGFDSLGTPATLARGTSVTRFRIRGVVLALAGLVMTLAGVMLISLHS